MPLFRRQLTDYFPRDELPHVDNELGDPPATVFLREIVEISDSVHHCERNFKRKQSGDFNKDSKDAYQTVSMASFALMMSHFETFQRHLFARLVNSMDLLDVTDDTALSKGLEKRGFTISLPRMLASRGQPREPGYLIADAIGGWHDPDRVNELFRLVLRDFNLYSNEVCEEITLLWQLRHSIVHTAGVVTREDSIKVTGLHHYLDRKLVFREGFITAVARRFHIMTQAVVEPLRIKIEAVVAPVPPPDDEEHAAGVAGDVCNLETIRPAWLRPNNA